MHSHETERLVILHVIVFQTQTFDSKLAVSRTAYNNLSRTLLLCKMNSDCNLSNLKKHRLCRNFITRVFRPEVIVGTLLKAI